MRYLVFLVLLNGCGSDKPATGSSTVTAPSTVPDKGSPQEPVPAAGVDPPTVPSTAVAKTSYTMYITSANIPACTQQNVDQLIYVKDLSQFQVCDGSTWSQIDIKGPAGKDGAAGAAGKDGAVGDQGAAGQVVVAPNNQWLDPITGTVWLIGGSGTYATAVAGCSSGWRLPTEVELIAAASHGLNSTSVTHPVDGWVTDSAVVNDRYVVGVATSQAQSVIADSSVHGIFCRK